jgi:pimeloyl-ACP methyl ester carboxylesterase
MRAEAPPHSVETSVGLVAYHDEGVGPPVLLLHGFPASSWQWRELVPLLAARFRVIAPDLPGSGASIPGDDVVLDLSTIAIAMRELLARLDVERVAIVAHGEGAGVAQLLALDGPGADALVLLDAATLDAWPSPDIERARHVVAEGRSSPETVRALVHEAYALGARHRDRLSEEVLDATAQPWMDDGGPARFRRVLEGLDGRGLEGRGPELGAIEAPVLLLWGEDDPAYPAEVAERLNDAMPASALGLLPGCGHFLVEEAVETIGPMIAEYLRARYALVPHGHGGTTDGIVMLQLERRPPWVDLEEDERDEWFDADDDTDGEEGAAKR